MNEWHINTGGRRSARLASPFAPLRLELEGERELFSSNERYRWQLQVIYAKAVAQLSSAVSLAIVRAKIDLATRR